MCSVAAFVVEAREEVGGAVAAMMCCLSWLVCPQLGTWQEKGPNLRKKREGGAAWREEGGEEGEGGEKERVLPRELHPHPPHDSQSRNEMEGFPHLPPPLPLLPRALVAARECSARQQQSALAHQQPVSDWTAVGPRWPDHGDSMEWPDQMDEEQREWQIPEGPFQKALRSWSERPLVCSPVRRFSGGGL